MIIYTILIFIAIMSVILITKPSFLFSNGNIKPFGLSEGKTIFSLHFIIIISIVFIHFFLSYFDCLLC